MNLWITPEPVAHLSTVPGMRKSTVDPEALRRAALVVDAATGRAEAETSIVSARTLGHAGLTAAAEELLQALTGGWTEAVAQLDAVAEGLRASAQVCERADDEGDRDMRAIGERW